MKTIMSVDAINNAWARLLFDEGDAEMLEVHLGTLYQFLNEEVREEDFLEIDLADDKKTIIGARKLVEETRKRKQEAIAQMNRLVYGTSKGY